MANISADVIKYAQQTEKKYGVPASVTIAQYGVESGWGTSDLSQKANNYFGITGKNHNTGKYIMMNGRSWASYGSMQESFDDHGRLLSTPLYSNAHKNTTNAFQYVDAISEIYAPSSDGNSGYAALVKQVIKDNNLTQYDQGGASVDNSTGYYIPGSDGSTGYYIPNAGSGAEVDVTAFGVDWAVVLGKIVKFICIAIVAIMAGVFFFSAFDIQNPLKGVKKGGNKDGG